MAVNRKSGKMLWLTIFDGESAPYMVDILTFEKEEITLGRAADNDIVLQSPIVSQHHAKFVMDQEMCMLFDCQSTNGIYVENERISSIRLQVGNIIRITGNEESAQNDVLILFGVEGKSSGWKRISLRDKPRIVVGRGNDCDISLDNSNVSKRHMVIDGSSAGYSLKVGKNAGGVIVNGCEVQREYTLHEKDIILLANTKFIFSYAGISYLTYEDGIQVDARDIVKTVKTSKGKLDIVDHIDLSIKQGEFVAIIGGSGAGKSSFMNCISGYSKPTGGQVLINGDDLYDNYETMKQIIGYVPQADIVYDTLTVQGMLNYAAMLRMPKDTSKKERKAKIAEVISMVELNGREKFLIKNLSGGQRKRVSIAVELLSDPKLFFLDEPSSGLDPGTEEKLMETLKKMSRMGKTIILITHNTMNIHLCDKIVFLGKGGKLCYHGTPQGAYDFFGVEQLAQVYNMVTDDPESWQQRFHEQSGVREEKQEEVANINAKIHYGGAVRKQIAILTRRYFSLMFHDIKRLILLVCQAPLLGFLMYLVADENLYEQYEITKAILFALSCCAFWIGILNSIQEVCKERTILKREYLSGLSLSAYIMSKFIVLGFFCLLQSGLLLGTVNVLIGLPEEGILMPAWVECYITTFLTALSATAMGLFVSSLFYNADRAMTVAPILLMPQILFSGLAFTLQGVIEKVSYVVNCRWAMEAYGSIANLNKLTMKIQEEVPQFVHEAEDFYTHSAWHLLFAWGVLFGYSVIYGVFCYIGLIHSERK